MAKIMTGMVNIGFGNYVVSDRIVAVLTPGTSPLKRLRDNAAGRDMLIDATHGKKTRSVIILDSNHVILSGIQTETITNRIASLAPDKEL